MRTPDRLRAKPARNSLIAVCAACCAVIAVDADGRTRGVTASLVVAILVYVLAEHVAAWIVLDRCRAVDRTLRTLVRLATGAVAITFGLLLGYPLYHGLPHVTGLFLTQTMRGVSQLRPVGGAAHAILGSAEQLLLTGLLAVPVGVGAAVFVTHPHRNAVARAAAGCVSVAMGLLAGVPAVVAGLVVYGLWVVGAGAGPSGAAAAIALVLLALPAIAIGTRSALRGVPSDITDAGLALGLTPGSVLLRVTIPTARSGIVTAACLGMARVAGETAPVLLTAGSSDSINQDLFHGPQESLGTYIYQQATSPIAGSSDRAWAAAALLIIAITTLVIVVRTVFPVRGGRGS
jgi:phosphate transport system permease protein